MQISARGDYAVRAVLEAASFGEGRPVTAAVLPRARQIPLSFLHGILLDWW
jgi:DNA-binding IscR family transcriptional regulator